MSDTLVVNLAVDKYRGAASYALSACPEGYRFVSMDRKGTKCKVTYKRVREVNHGERLGAQYSRGDRAASGPATEPERTYSGNRGNL